MQEKISIWVKTTLLIGSSLTIMSSATIAPSLPQMSEVFEDVPNAAFLSKLILTLPALFIAMCAPLAGLFIDKFGRKVLFIAGLALYAIAGSAGTYLDTLYGLLISRALLGVSVAAIMTCATTLIGDYFHGQDRNKFMGLQGSTMAMGGVIYILIGGLLADITWRGPFYIYLFSLLLIPVAYFSLYEPEKTKPEPLASPPIITPIPSRTIFLIFLTGFTGMILFYMVPVQIPFFLQKIDPVSNTLIGVAIACSTLMGAVVSAFYQKIKSKLSFSAIYGYTFVIMATGYLVIGTSTTYEQVVTGLIINGLGMGMMMPNGSTWIMSISPVAIRGRVVAGMTTAAFMGQFVSPLASQPLVEYMKAGYAFIAASIAMVAIALGFIFISVINSKKRILAE